MLLYFCLFVNNIPYDVGRSNHLQKLQFSNSHYTIYSVLLRVSLLLPYALYGPLGKWDRETAIKLSFQKEIPLPIVLFNHYHYKVNRILFVCWESYTCIAIWVCAYEYLDAEFVLYFTFSSNSRCDTWIKNGRKWNKNVNIEGKN